MCGGGGGLRVHDSGKREVGKIKKDTKSSRKGDG